MAVAVRELARFPQQREESELRALWADVEALEAQSVDPDKADELRRRVRFYLARLAAAAPDVLETSSAASALTGWLAEPIARHAAATPPAARAPVAVARRTEGRRPNVAVATVVLLLLLLPLVALVRGYQAMVVLSGSMEPTIPVGTLVLVEPVRAEQVAPGDVVTFPHPDRPGENVTHRVVKIDDGPTGRFLRTKGDANREPDAWRVPVAGQLGRYVASVPRLGFVFRTAADPTGRMALMVLPSLLLGAMALLNIWQGGPARSG